MGSDQGAAPVLSEVVAVLEELYPPGDAEDWDRVGLVCGDPAAPVRRVLLAVDPTADVVQEAVDVGADLLLVHHPLLLRGVSSVAATTPKGRAVHALVRAGCALYTAHTNADSARPGVSDALARVLGLTDLAPLAPRPPGPGPRGLGRVGVLARPTPLRAFAEVVAAALPATAGGVRVAGDPDAPVQRVAVCGGAGDGLLEAARTSGADVLVTADLRHHPASEARELAVGGRPHLVDVAHWASEWPWLNGAAERLAAALAARGLAVTTTVSSRRTDPWTFHVPSTTPTPEGSSR